MTLTPNIPHAAFNARAATDPHRVSGARAATSAATPAWRWLRATLRAKRRGQTVPLTVIILPFLLVFTLLVIEVAERWLEVAMVEDALQQATRSAVQQLDYSAFARNETRLRGGTTCVSLTLAQARAQSSPCVAVIAVADQFFQTNLRGVRGLVESPAAVAARVRWTIRPTGGGCTYSDGTLVPGAPQPVLCAEVRPMMRGLVGWGTYAPRIVAADRLDSVR